MNASFQMHQRTKNPPEGGLAVRLQLLTPSQKPTQRTGGTLSANWDFKSRLSGFQSVFPVSEGENRLRTSGLLFQGAL